VRLNRLVTGSRLGRVNATAPERTPNLAILATPRSVTRRLSRSHELRTSPASRPGVRTLAQPSSPIRDACPPNRMYEPDELDRIVPVAEFPQCDNDASSPFL
jgi:hypothetical protein